MTNSLVGRRLGKYEIQAEIGKGGMGMVYQGYDPFLERRVAVKVLAPHLVWEPGFVDRFLREARAAARLKHTSIVTIYDVGQEGNWHYIVMEYLEGQTLTQLIRQRGPFPPEQALAVLRQLAAALDHAHRHGLVHRDVKPGNVVVSRSGRATLTDFGVARAAQETRLTMTGARVGTPQYMSPEQAQGEQVDHRTDIYSLAVVTYEMLAGRAPFAAATPHAVLHQLIYDPPPPVRSLRPDLPPEVDGVLDKALAKAPARRYETAGSLAEAMGQALAGRTYPEGVRRQPAGAIPARPRATAQPQESVRPAALSPTQVRAPVQPGTARPAALSPAQVRAPVQPRKSASREVGRSRPRGWILWLGWLLGTVVGWVAGLAVAEPIAQTVGQSIAEVADIALAEIVSGAVVHSLLGLALGFLQWLVLRHFIRKAGWWVLASFLGWAVVGSVKWGQGMVIDAALYEGMGWLDMIGAAAAGPLIGIVLGTVLEGLTGLVIGVAQWLVLQGKARNAGRWIPINMVAWAANPLLLGTLGWVLGEPPEETMAWLFRTLGGVMPAVITATGLVRLVCRNRRDVTPQR